MKLNVLVDYQVDFVNGALGFQTAKYLDRLILAWMQKAIANGEPVIVTLDTHSPSYLETREGKLLPVEHCIKGTNGHKLYGKTGEFLMANRDKVRFLEKKSFGVSPADMEILRAGYLGVTEVEFGGLDGCICVLSNLVTFQSAYPEARMVLNAALVDSSNRMALCEMFDVARMLQVDIRNAPRYTVALGHKDGAMAIEGFQTGDLREALLYAGSLHRVHKLPAYVLMYRGGDEPLVKLTPQQLLCYEVTSVGEKED